MNTIVLMAGDATRFLNSKYNDLKPLINIKGQPIVKWTTDSLGFDFSKITFAIRTDQNKKFLIEERLAYVYQKTNIDFCRFNSLTRGNLETAYFSTLNIVDIDQPLLILDSDNKYNGSGFFDFVSNISDKDFAVICYFDPLDDSTKWCFAVPDGDKIIQIGEKDEEVLNHGGKPMVGVFYFSSADLFINVAKSILTKGLTCKNEFYMSQSINALLDCGVSVYGLKVDEVVQLGTPIDVEKFENA